MRINEKDQKIEKRENIDLDVCSNIFWARLLYEKYNKKI